MTALFQIKKVQVEMVCDRKFLVGDEKILLEPGYTEANFIKTYSDYAAIPRGEPAKPLTFREALSKTYYSEDKKEKLMVYFAQPTTSGKQLGVEVIKDFVQKLKNEDPNQAIMITYLPLSYESRVAIDTLGKVFIQIFQDQQLTFNVTKHSIVPKHEVLTPENQRKFLEKNKIKITQLPILRLSDPVSRYYGFRPGQVVRIYRKSFGLDTPVKNKIFYRAVSFT